MKTKKASLLIAVALLALNACAGGDIVPVSRMQDVLSYRGFGVNRPADERWYLRQSAQRPTVAFFNMAPLSSTHSFHAGVELVQLANHPQSEDEFKSVLDAELNKRSERFQPISYRSELTRIQGQWAIRYESRVIDRAPRGLPGPLVMTRIGWVALHPNWPRTVVQAYYSERGAEAEVNGVMDRVGQRFLQGVALHSAPYVPVE